MTHRVAEADHIDATLEHVIRKLGRKASIANHDGSDRVVSVSMQQIVSNNN